LAFFDVFAWIVLLLLVATGVGVIVFLGLWPGKVARARNHPQAEAIAIGSGRYPAADIEAAGEQLPVPPPTPTGVPVQILE